MVNEGIYGTPSSGPVVLMPDNVAGCVEYHQEWWA